MWPGQIATGFVRNGAKVYISSRSAKDCAETVEELNKLGPGTCIAIPADMQKVSEVERLVKELSAKEKALHVLVNNAGAAWGAQIDDYPVSQNNRKSCGFSYIYCHRSDEFCVFV